MDRRLIHVQGPLDEIETLGRCKPLIIKAASKESRGTKGFRRKYIYIGIGNKASRKFFKTPWTPDPLDMSSFIVLAE